MAKEAYIEIDGKRIQLTIEQMKALGIYEEPKVNPFERIKNIHYYCIDSYGEVLKCYDRTYLDYKKFNIANYCTDESIMKQRALHETLNRLLWRFSMENDGDKIDWKDNYSLKHVILFDNKNKCFKVDWYTFAKFDGSIYFSKEEIAKRAIDEIIIPFMKEYPEFIW